MVSAGLELFPFLLHTANISPWPHALHRTELDIVICSKALDCGLSVAAWTLVGWSTCIPENKSQGKSSGVYAVAALVIAP